MYFSTHNINILQGCKLSSAIFPIDNDYTNLNLIKLRKEPINIYNDNFR